MKLNDKTWKLYLWNLKALNYLKCLFQLIPEISSLTWFTTIVPLVLVVTMTAVKDATDDYGYLLLSIPAVSALVVTFQK